MRRREIAVARRNREMAVWVRGQEVNVSVMDIFHIVGGAEFSPPVVSMNGILIHGF